MRTVNRVFNATGQTVGEVIRVRRLARAREDLTEATALSPSIAHRWGFSDRATSAAASKRTTALAARVPDGAGGDPFNDLALRYKTPAPAR